MRVASCRPEARAKRPRLARPTRPRINSTMPNTKQMDGMEHAPKQETRGVSYCSCRGNLECFITARNFACAHYYAKNKKIS